nr:beta-galactosidase family protein [Streptococcus sp. S784/96/1]
MLKFEISNDKNFFLNQKPFKILSGAIHYFRIHPDDWYHSLYNLKALGFNTVETYVPWNLHQPTKDSFTVAESLDIERFLTIAQKLGLYAIVRPSPYICAEWEWGGLPAWLLTENVRVRTSDPKFIYYVDCYYAKLLPILAKHQLSHGGNILMFQIENEYGSYGEEKDYLRAIKSLMEKYGLEGPFFTSDGPWRATLRAGSLIEDDVLVTGNFGSKAASNFKQMQDFFDEHNRTYPLMCMEFWDGWFNRWGEEVVTREPEELAESVMECIELGSINLYMFHGGTNFGFMNGCSARGQKDLPQVTSYDYDAVLDEAGNPTQKFFEIQKRLKTRFPELITAMPLTKKIKTYPSVTLSQKTGLFGNLKNVSVLKTNPYPLSMEELGQNTGYVLYQTELERDKDDAERLRVIDARDRIQVYENDYHVATQYQDEIGEDIALEMTQKYTNLKILVENMGRVNYGHKLEAATQRKGLGRGAIVDLHFIGNWKHYSLPLDSVSNLDFSKEWKSGQPSFYHYQLNIDELADTYLDMTGFGKGVVFVNNMNIGRFWEKGPILTLYLPKGYLKKGENSIVVFETEGRYKERITFTDRPKIKNIK